MRLARKEVRELVALLETEGWTFIGMTGKGHLAFRHPSGARFYGASTPGCSRSRVRALHDARRAVRAAQSSNRGCRNGVDDDE